MEGTGESGVSPRAGDTQQAAYVPSANRASCPAEVTILRAAGSRRSSLLPYLRCPSGEAEPRCRGEKGAGEARPAPAQAGRREDLRWHPLYSADGQAEMGRRLPSPLRHSTTGALWATLPPQRGCPPKGKGGGCLGLGAETLNTKQGEGGGAGQSGTI